MKRYKHLFFDLDRTFWDVETNQVNAHRELFDTFSLESHFPDFHSYFTTFITINKALWAQYENGLIKSKELREDRFYKLLCSHQIEDKQLAWAMNEAYLRILPRYNALIPHTIEILEYLKAKAYPMHIITNGLSEVQRNKMLNSGILPYFTHIVISEKVGVNKPFSDIFEYALNQVGVSVADSIMVGDDAKNDIMGALNVGMDCVWLNSNNLTPTLSPTYEIKTLMELKNIF